MYSIIGYKTWNGIIRFRGDMTVSNEVGLYSDSLTGVKELVDCLKLFLIAINVGVELLMEIST